MTASKLKIGPSWHALLADEFHSEYFAKLENFLSDEKSKQGFYPPEDQVFNAFNSCPVDKVRVIILGQDPYHGPDQAHGLCFSVNDGVTPFPPSLLNILKALNKDLGIHETPRSGNLTKWAEQGVLLLNATLTVRIPLAGTPSKERAGTHKGQGWERFTDAAIKNLSEARENLVFLLWGGHAQKKKTIIHPDNGHLILEAPHPSPLSAYRGFMDCKHFSRTNAFLVEHGKAPIDWNLNNDRH